MNQAALKDPQPTPRRQQARIAVLRGLRSGGILERIRDSRWRQRRLLILCYHGVALDEEHCWQSSLFVESAMLKERFEILRAGGYNVLPLAEAIERLYKKDLPPRSVVITFDDGNYDFYEKAYPLLKSYDFPATVYQTTYYSQQKFPVFPVVCSYILWKRRDLELRANSTIGLTQNVALQTAQARQLVLNELVLFAEGRNFSTLQKNELTAQVADSLGFDYQALMKNRILSLMSLEQIRELSAQGIDFQLHTHRHRTPRDQSLFEREIDENSQVLTSATGSRPQHFCYPSGDYDMKFLPWLSGRAVLSATTCDPGLATAEDHPLLLPRFIDTTSRTALEFESWLTGVGDLLSVKARTAWSRKRAKS